MTMIVRPGVRGDPRARGALDARSLETALPAGEHRFHGRFGPGVGAGSPPTRAKRTGIIMRGEHPPVRTGMLLPRPVARRRPGEGGALFSERSAVAGRGCEPSGAVEPRLFVQ